MAVDRLGSDSLRRAALCAIQCESCSTGITSLPVASSIAHQDLYVASKSSKGLHLQGFFFFYVSLWRFITAWQNKSSAHWMVTKEAAAFLFMVRGRKYSCYFCCVPNPHTQPLSQSPNSCLEERLHVKICCVFSLVLNVRTKPGLNTLLLKAGLHVWFDRHKEMFLQGVMATE